MGLAKAPNRRYPQTIGYRPRNVKVFGAVRGVENLSRAYGEYYPRVRGPGFVFFIVDVSAVTPLLGRTSWFLMKPFWIATPGSLQFVRHSARAREGSEVRHATR